MADLVVMHSEVCRDSYAAQGLDTTKVRVIPLGFPEIGPAVDAETKNISGPLKILWAGNFSPLKGGHHFLRALEAVAPATNVEVKVYGNRLPCGPVPNLPLKFFPTVPRAQLFQEYRRADVLVHATLADAFGLAVTEAVSHGLPVITTRGAGVSEQIHSGRTGFVIPAADTDVLAQTLRWCAANRDSLVKIGIAGQKAAASWQWCHYREALSVMLAGILGKDCPDPAAMLMV